MSFIVEQGRAAGLSWPQKVMKTKLIGVLMVAILAAGCGGLASGLIPKPVPTPMLMVTPASLEMSMTGPAHEQNITASESGQNFFTAESTNINVATVAPVNGSNNAFTVTAVGAGNCSINVSDENGQNFPVKVMVSN
jgi:ABC-type glycerol-3-phosphate transport system substrate-binding protein